jgi:hypothetical protein
MNSNEFNATPSIPPPANNPQTFLNSYLSAMRNTIITLTLGIGIYGFSKTFKDKNAERIMRLLSITMYVYSIVLCINSTLMFRSYLESITEDEEKMLPKYINLDYWKVYEVLGWVFAAVLLILILLATKRYIKKLL